MRIDRVDFTTPDGRPYEIRSSVRRDATSFWKLSWRLHKEEPQIGLAEPSEFQLSVDQVARYTKTAAKADNGCLLVAVAGNEVVGQLTLEGGRYRKTAHVAEMGVTVKKEWRRQGVGTNLIGTALSAARASGLRRVVLKMFANNEPALRLYEGLGFEIEGRRRGHVLIDGHYVDEILMARDLAGEPPPSRRG